MFDYRLGSRSAGRDRSMNSMHSHAYGPDAVRPPAPQDEANVITALLAMLWRRKRFIAAFCGSALVITGLVALFLSNQYTAEVLIQARLAREDQKSQQGAATPSSGIVIEAASVIETEARIIRSRAIAQRVVARLELTKHPSFVHGSLTTRLFELLLSMSPWSEAPASRSSEDSASGARYSSNPLEFLVSIWQRIHGYDSPSAEDLIALAVMRQLKVSNDPKTYLINISYTSNSPELSARIANAFAEEYLQIRSEAAARREFADVAAVYGPKHPILMNAKAKLDEALKQRRAGDSAQFLMLAEPIAAPSGPNRSVILALALLGSFGAAVVVVLLLERADHGFRTDREVVTETELPCLATLPELTRAFSDATVAYSEAARAITAATGVVLSPVKAKVVMLTSCVPGEGKSLLSVSLARTLIEMGRRTLIINVSTKDSTNEVSPESEALEDVLDGIERGLPSLERQQAQRLLVLNRTARADGSHKLVTAPAFSRLVAQARDFYDVILIEAPPVMLFADALYLGRFADFVVHVVRWHRTPRRTVAAALQRMRNLGIRVNGIVLSRVDRGAHQLHCGVDLRDYFGQSQPALASCPVESSLVQEREPNEAS